MARYGLVVGVATYKKPLGNLSKTESDAKAVHDLLKQYGEFDDIQVLTGEVTAEQLGDALTRLIEQAHKSETLIYFSGHAVVVKRTSNKTRGYLALSDTILKIKNGDLVGIDNAYELEDLSSLVGEANLSNLVILLDSCHSEILLEQGRGFLQRTTVEDTFKGMPKDYFLVSACRKFEEAYAMRSESYSIFTGALLQSLTKDKANDRGIVNASTMYGHVCSQLIGTGQEAVDLGFGGGSIRIVDYREVVAKLEVDETSPYVGLNAFDEKTAKYFCGRDSQIDLLLRKIEESRFVPVIGASGSGKSSLVRAGLMPALAKQGWCVLPPIKPWFNPLMLLKQALVEQFYKLPTEIKKAYAKLESEGLNAILPERSPRVLLVVDQFEELFTVCANEQERQEFIRLLAEGSDREGRLTIVTTMRADFVEQALQYPALAKLIQRDRAFWLVPLEPSELRDAIAEPARMQGYELAEGLLEVICQDVEAEKNSLPLLEFALTELWGKRDRQNHRLTLTAYAEMGKLRGALDRHAKQLYEGLSSDVERDWTRRLFLQLVRTGQDVRDTRQRQAKQFLLGMARSEEDREAIANLLEIFAGADGRLLTTGEENNVAFVDLAHEALIDGWQMFKEWRSQDRDLRRLGDRVKDAFDEFNRAKEEDKDGFLLPRGVFAQIEEVEVAINDYLTPEQQNFVQRNRYKYKPWLNPENLPEMVDIPSGTFWMGSPKGKGDNDDKPHHQVTVKAFQMGKYPVTQAQWRTVAMSPKVAIDLSLNPSYYRGEDCSVEKVDWYEAQEFCARLSRLTGESYRLPSEAEWEYSCRAGAEEYTEYCFGDDEDQLEEYAWYDKNSDRKTHPIGQKLPNAWGIYDMHGNVWEWCADDWHDSYEEAPIDSQIWTEDIKNHEDGGETAKLLRGGSWNNLAWGCRAALRSRCHATLQYSYIGFRVVFACSS